MNTSYVRGQNLVVSKEGRECYPFIALVFEVSFSFFIILLSVIIAETSVITEEQSSFSGKIIGGDG